MPELLPWLAAVGAVGTAVVPVLWYGIALYRGLLDKLETERQSRDEAFEGIRIEQAKIRQELYGVNGDNGMKGRLAELGRRTHDIPTIKTIMLMIEEEHERHQREGK